MLDKDFASGIRILRPLRTITPYLCDYCMHTVRIVFIARELHLCELFPHAQPKYQQSFVGQDFPAD